jgi:peptidyl-prolyl cis-trans isomerase SurA
MKKYAIIAALLMLSLNYSSNAQKAKVDADKVVVEIGKMKVTTSELQRAFKKNMSRTNDNLFQLPKEQIIDFINLYSNFRLKVTDAIDRGFLKDSSVIAEIEQNRKILSESFYYDKVLTEPNVKKFIKIREKEYLVGIILANVKQNADFIDTTEAFKKISNAQRRINNGDSFEEMAMAYSDDYETGKNGGRIPNYITSGKVQRPIEDAIVNTKPGQVYPEIIKTSYGYFLVKVYEEQKRELVRVRHILISQNETRDSLTAYRKTDSLLTLIKNGADFSQLAKQNSDDAVTAVNGGDLGGYYSRSTGMDASSYPLATEFENKVYTMKDGEISDIIKTNFGFHIVKRDSSKLPDLKAESEELRRIYKRLYFKLDQIALMDSLKNKARFKVYNDVLHQITSFLDTNATNLADDWDKSIPERIKKNILFEVFNKNTTVQQFLEIVNSDQKYRGAALNPNGIHTMINAIVEPIVFADATKNLEKDYPEFDNLMKEFRDGILLFKVEAMEVWDKMKFDSALARTYYDSTKSKYFTEDAYDISEIYFLDKSIADSVYNRIKSGENFDDVASKETQRSGFREKNGKWGKVYVKSNTLAKHAKESNAKPGDILPPFANDPGYSIIRVTDIFPPRNKTFEEAIPDFSPQYQEILQNKLSAQWLNSLKKKYPLKIIEAELNKKISENK